MKCVITGASRGIGLELVRQGLMAGHHIVAIARQAEKSKPLVQLQSEYTENLTLFSADLTLKKDLAALTKAAQRWGQVDVLINNAGVLHEEDRFEHFSETFAVNVTAPHFVTQALLENLQLAPNPKVVNITSLMGSLGDNRSGGYYSYRSSKAALNMITVSLARDHESLTAIVIHPGWVKTDMGGPQAPVSPEESAKGIWAKAFAARQEDSGRFFDYRGKELPW